MLLQYFGFQQEPFGTTPDSRYLYPSHTHREALASLECGFLSNRGFTAMIAPPGMGKTTLLFRFLNHIRESARTVFLFTIDAECKPREFVGYILRDIGITPGQSSSEMNEQLTEALVTENRAGRKFVVVIDEAQNLSDAVLERVRLLTNFESSTGKLMQIVLSGQPQLSDKLMQASLVQLRQRISTVCRLEPLSVDETIAYIDYRLKQAGYDGEPLFTRDALKLIADVSQGIPRTINNLCFNALSLSCALKSKQVDDRMVAEAIADLQLIPQAGEPVAAVGDVAVEQPSERKQRKQTKRLLKFWVPAAAVLLVLCALGVVWLIGFRVPWSHAAVDDRALDLKAPLTSVPAPAATDTGETRATETAPNSATFAITVEPDQTLQDISEQYLGGYDLQRLHQIQALNPKLTDPDHIEVGQRIWLPGPPQVSVANSATPTAKVRELP
jgi:type II secretory pathway predicted ATPase ExeA